METFLTFAASVKKEDFGTVHCCNFGSYYETMEFLRLTYNDIRILEWTTEDSSSLIVRKNPNSEFNTIISYKEKIEEEKTFEDKLKQNILSKYSTRSELVKYIYKSKDFLSYLDSDWDWLTLDYFELDTLKLPNAINIYMKNCKNLTKLILPKSNSISIYNCPNLVNLEISKNTTSLCFNDKIPSMDKIKIIII